MGMPNLRVRVVKPVDNVVPMAKRVPMAKSKAMTKAQLVVQTMKEATMLRRFSHCPKCQIGRNVLVFSISWGGWPARYLQKCTECHYYYGWRSTGGETHLSQELPWWANK